MATNQEIWESANGDYSKLWCACQDATPTRYEGGNLYDSIVDEYGDSGNETSGDDVNRELKCEPDYVREVMGL